MRSTRASAAVARLNSRSVGAEYRMIVTGGGQFILNVQSDGEERRLSAALSLDEFVRLVDSMTPKSPPRVTKSEAAFMKQLVRKNRAP